MMNQSETWRLHRVWLMVGLTLVIVALAALGVAHPRSSAGASTPKQTIAISLDTSPLGAITDIETTITRTLVSGYVNVRVRASDLSNYDAVALSVYTDNGPGSDGAVRRGVVGQSETDEAIAIRVWTPNFGPAPAVFPKPGQDDYWSEYWFRVYDRAESVADPHCDTPMFQQTELFKWCDWVADSVSIEQPVYFTLALEKKVSPSFMRLI